MTTYSTSIEGDDNASFVVSTRENDTSYMKVYIGLSKNLEGAIDEGESMSSDETYYVYFGYHVEVNNKTDEASYAYDSTSDYFNDLLSLCIDAIYRANDAESDKDVYREIAKGVEQMLKIGGSNSSDIGVHPLPLASLWNYN